MFDDICLLRAVAARHRWARLALATTALGLALLAPAQAAVTVTRLLPACSVVSGSTFVVDLVVEVTGSAPAALIIEEQPPAGWTITAATWSCDGRDDPFPPIVTGGTCRWLFDPLGLPVESGLIRLTLTLPTPTAGSHAFDGDSKWIEAATEAGDAVDRQRDLTVGALHSGWNALSLPFAVPDLAALNLLLRDERGRSLLAGPVWVYDTTSGAQAPSTGPLEAAQGFLACIPTTGSWNLLVAATPAVDLRISPGWNLTGVCQETSVADIQAGEPAIGPVWEWDPRLRTYRRLPGDGVLLPGYAYWVYLDGPAPVVIPLGQPL